MTEILESLNLTKVKDFKGDVQQKTWKSSYDSINKLFGNGLTQGCVFQMYGFRGTGKTTLLLQMLEDFSNQTPTAYLTTEETKEQIIAKCERLNVKNVMVGKVTDLEEILEVIKHYKIVVLDSFQMISSTLNQKKIITQLVNTAKDFNCSLGIVCQLTKNGRDKGVSDVGHLCDQVIKLWSGVSEYFGMIGKAILLDSSKNRFGKTGIMVLENGDNGYNFENPWNEDLVDEIEKIAMKVER